MGDSGSTDGDGHSGHRRVGNAQQSGPAYQTDVLAGFRRGGPRRGATAAEVPAELGLVVEDAAESFCGAVVGFESGAVVLEDRFGKRRRSRSCLSAR